MNRATLMPFVVLILVCAGVALSLPFLRHKYDEWFVFPALRAQISDSLLDPASTQYRNEFLTSGGVLCGQLNSKNSAGGYVGFHRYISGAHLRYLETVGWVEKQGETRSAEDITEMLEAQNEVLRETIQLLKANPDVSRPSEEAVHKMTIRKLFELKWKKICAR